MTLSIRLGQCWIVRLTKSEMAVRIDDYEPKGGWVARSLSHGRRVWVRNADCLLRRCDENGLDIVADETEPNRRSTALPPEPQDSQPEIAEPKPEAIFVPRFVPKPPEPPKAATLLEAAVIVLKSKRTGMSSKEIIAAVQEQGLWNPTGKTPWLTLHTALSREIESKGSSSRFQKMKERGKFMLR